jgi:hypothetical protein
VYDGVEDIDIESLPNSFVLKVNHGSGQQILVKDKSEIDWEHELKLLRKWLSSNHYYNGREWGYKNIIPRIICEKYIEENGKLPTDYKFFCFNGVPRFLEVHKCRYEGQKKNIYDMDWKLLEFQKGNYPHITEQLEKPLGFEKMIDYAERLSKGFPFVRVDFYNVEGRIYFGEMTFYPGNGVSMFYPEEYNLTIGEYIELP